MYFILSRHRYKFTLGTVVCFNAKTTIFISCAVGILVMCQTLSCFPPTIACGLSVPEDSR